jgi:hypothetical protein
MPHQVMVGTEAMTACFVAAPTTTGFSFACIHRVIAEAQLPRARRRGMGPAMGVLSESAALVRRRAAMLGDDLGRFLAGSVGILLGVDDLQHRRDRFHLGAGGPR